MPALFPPPLATSSICSLCSPHPSLSISLSLSLFYCSFHCLSVPCASNTNHFLSLSLSLPLLQLSSLL